MSESSPRLILASASPRRRELLAGLGLEFEVQPAAIDEGRHDGESPGDLVRRLGLDKARTVAKTHPGAVVLGSDTAVILDGEPLGKPRDRDHGIAMLSALSGREHEVLSSVALAGPEGETVRLNRSRVRFRSLAREEIAAYWDTGEPADKAGAYAIQGLGGIFVERLEGSFSGVMGLPVFETARLLTDAGIPLLGRRRAGIGPVE